MDVIVTRKYQDASAKPDFRHDIFTFFQLFIDFIQ
jgi:hypothetical protein